MDARLSRASSCARPANAGKTKSQSHRTALQYYRGRYQNPKKVPGFRYVIEEGE